MDYSTALLAGAVAGTSVDLSLFPLDTLKTRLQAGPGFWASGGFSGIYRGVGSAVVGSAPGAALFFVTYESVKHALGHNTNGPSFGSGSAYTHMLAASLGEIAACAVRVPTEVVKQRAQAGQFASSAQALAAILRGPSVFSNLYRGWGATILREVPFTVVQFPLWEAMKAWRRGTKNGQEVSAFESAAFGSLAGGIAAAATTPLDVLKTRIMLSTERQSLATMVRSIMAEQGASAFFAGLGPRVTWISIGGAIFLGSYQWVVNFVGTRHGSNSDDKSRIDL
ncbi:S-adenosylmethionine transporter [Sporothrix stenoceras]|uniref:S-adenosylmethionine transporter n=1 Tax=Sporothrix stenoceras TaxID=5173 RepID=A0ABR3ZCZ2_9PEZI